MKKLFKVLKWGLVGFGILSTGISIYAIWKSLKRKDK
jgi:hypothetical protein